MVITSLGKHTASFNHGPSTRLGCSTEFLVRLIHSQLGEANGLFTFDEELDGDDQATLTLHFNGIEITKSASDYFEAMCRIRDELEASGWRPYCYGAAKTVFPSGMGRDMGRGLQAYKLRLGQHAKMSDLVCIFDSEPGLELATTQEQEQFYYETWLKQPRV